MVEVEEVKYGMLMMVLCVREGRVYDVWITFGSVHDVRAFSERKKRSLWVRGLVENCVVYGDRGYMKVLKVSRTIADLEGEEKIASPFK